MEDRKSQIIQVATDFIKKYGYDSFSYKDLSEAVGITKATLHHHFAKKEDLGLAVLLTIKGQLEYLEEKTFEIKDAQERLVFFFQALRGTIESGDICPISSMQAEYNVIPDVLKDLIRQVSALELSILTRILEVGREEKAFSFEGDANKRALVMMTAYKGALIYSRSVDASTLDLVMDDIISEVMKVHENADGSIS